jgi:hypothetical protein
MAQWIAFIYMMWKALACFNVHPYPVVVVTSEPTNLSAGNTANTIEIIRTWNFRVVVPFWGWHGEIGRTVCKTNEILR